MVNDTFPPWKSHLDRSSEPDPSYHHKDESWKFRAPYQFQEDEKFGPVKWQAMCHCGRVQYQIKSERPVAAKYCHCRGCQVLHGKLNCSLYKNANLYYATKYDDINKSFFQTAAPFQWCAIFPKTDLRFKQGTDSLMFYSSHEMSREYQLPTKVYCANCNSPIMDEGRNMCLVFPELIDLGQTEEEHLTRRTVFEIK
jgi:hypothetical protein